MEKQVARELFDRACSVSSLMRGDFKGLRVFCLSAESLSLIMQRRDEPWFNHALIYTPEQLYRSNGFAGQLKDQLVSSKIPLATLKVLDKYWHAISLVDQGRVGYFPLAAKQLDGLRATPKVNLVLGDPGSEEYKNLMVLLSEQKPVPIAGPTLYEEENKEIITAKEKLRRLKVIEELILNPAFNGLNASFVGPLPKINFPYSRSSLQQSGASVGAIHSSYRDVFQNVGEVKEQLDDDRVLLLCGFSSGCDFIAREACLRLAANPDNNILAVLQMNRQEAVKYHRAFNEIRDELYGRALILRNFFDPYVYKWDRDDLRFEVGSEERPTEEYFQLFHGEESRIKRLLEIASGDKEGRTYVIMTTQYDTIGMLRRAIRRSSYSRERIAILESRLEWIESKGYYKEIDIPADGRGYGYLCQAGELIESWRREFGHDEYPEWSVDIPLLRGYAVIAGSFRPSLWDHMLRTLLHRNLNKKEEALVTAGQIYKAAGEAWNDLHQKIGLVKKAFGLSG